MPLSDHLLKGQHKSNRRNTTNHAFSHFARTATHRKNVNPVFDDVVELEIDLSREKDLMIGKFIALTVMDHDDLSEDDLIGTVVINLASLVGGDGGNGVRLRREKGGTSRIEGEAAGGRVEENYRHRRTVPCHVSSLRALFMLTPPPPNCPPQCPSP